ncbi:MAG: YihY/virulence factor BrkB family protein [Clostridium sp.]|nr:YihY/virulence factor BrkB family protein [Clostridium sp.]MCM1444112.1 YihY/virulence factor BrkB family protein [Candidatus Amulumruptor caecigallinarius]
MKEYFDRVLLWFKKLFRIINRPDMKVLPGHLAFFLVMSIFPVFTLIGFFSSLFNLSIDSLTNLLSTAIPKDVSGLLISFITGSLDFKVGFSMLAGFIIASNGAYSLIVTSNQLYKLDSSNYIKRRIKAILLTILLLVLFIFLIVVFAFGNDIIRFLSNIGFLNGVINIIMKVYQIFKIPLGLLIVFLIIKIIYATTPDSRVPGKYTTNGAIFTTVVGALVTIIYSYYVDNFSNYGLFYGSLTNIVVLMMYLYFISYIIVIGISINANNYNIEKSE